MHVFLSIIFTTLLFPALTPYGHGYFQHDSIIEVKVAFMEFYDRQGNLIVLEPDGRFSHLALGVQSLQHHDTQWIHAHPWKGVIIDNWESLDSMGKVTTVLTIDTEILDVEQLNAMIGRPYDRNFLWYDDAIYCSELIGKALGLKTNPMYFSMELWPERFQQFNGLPGLSPDGAYQQLKELALNYQVLTRN